MDESAEERVDTMFTLRCPHDNGPPAASQCGECWAEEIREAEACAREEAMREYAAVLEDWDQAKGELDAAAQERGIELLHSTLAGKLAGFIRAMDGQIEEARREALGQCKRDVCMYCGKRALGYLPAEGPNEAGNWTHCPQTRTGIPLLCHATAIFAREHFECAKLEERDGEG